VPGLDSTTSERGPEKSLACSARWFFDGLLRLFCLEWIREFSIVPTPQAGFLVGEIF